MNEVDIDPVGELIEYAIPQGGELYKEYQGDILFPVNKFEMPDAEYEFCCRMANAEIKELRDGTAPPDPVDIYIDVGVNVGQFTQLEYATLKRQSSKTKKSVRDGHAPAKQEIDKLILIVRELRTRPDIIDCIDDLVEKGITQISPSYSPKKRALQYALIADRAFAENDMITYTKYVGHLDNIQGTIARAREQQKRIAERDITHAGVPTKIEYVEKDVKTDK